MAGGGSGIILLLVGRQWESATAAYVRMRGEIPLFPPESFLPSPALNSIKMALTARFGHL
jgi:hypothetical protein